ncbi:MAG TPA: FkbM family methyltransferase [Acidobacteriaceae bacterium]|nr:FkbM family methyltransferase [Acidobacteriaceae bacterium]
MEWKVPFNWEFARQVGPVKFLWRTLRRQCDKRLLQRDSYLNLPTGRRMYLPRNSYCASEIYVTNANIDWGGDAYFARYADSKKDFLDVGANIGYYSLYLSPLVRDVFAFEPDPRNFAALNINAATGRNIKHIAKAVSSSTGNVSMDISGNPEISKVVSGDNGTLSVEAITIDSFVSQNPDVSIGLIKIDAEGHESAVLAGAYDTIERDQPLLFIEGGDAPKDIQDLIDFRKRFDYETYAFIYKQSQPSKSYLVRLDADTFSSIRKKMVFLVPSRLAAHFHADSVAFRR